MAIGNMHRTLTFLFLLLWSSSFARFIEAGRYIPTKRQETRLQEVRRVQRKAQRIGSIPPTCYKVCPNCRDCVAVQVPVSWENRRITTTAYSRVGDAGNYKPISWKCKCGDVFFNP